jgi:hypothetical protein
VNPTDRFAAAVRAMHGSPAYALVESLGAALEGTGWSGAS